MDLRHVIVLLIIGVTLVLAQSSKTTTAKATTTTKPTTVVTTTATKPTTVVTTTATNATTVLTTTSGKTNTTTAPPTTTTKVTTMKATTTPMTTTPPRTIFRVDNTQGSACILEELTAKFIIKYNKTENNKTVMAQITFELPQTSQVDANKSMCGSAATNSSNATNPEIVLTFDAPELGNSFVQVFKIKGDTAYLASITLSLNHTETLFPNSTDAGKLVKYSGTLPPSTFETKSGQFFLCNSPEPFKVNQNANVTFSDMKVQTMGIVNDTFGTKDQCTQDMTTTPMTTTVHTTTPPSPPPADWTIKNKDNKICMLVNMTMKFEIGYNKTNNKTGMVKFTLPMNAQTTNSTCNSDNATLLLTFFGGWKLQLNFQKYGNKTYNATMMSLLYIYNSTLFPNTTDAGKQVNVKTNQTNIEAAVGSYFSCQSNQTFTEMNVNFTMSDVAIQPFVNPKDQGFGKESECPADQEFNNIVPIAVGCALAGLVIIVLVAYLIGRQRSSKSGYESV